MMFRVSVGRQDHPGNLGLSRERADGGLGQQVDTEVTLSGENGDHGGENSSAGRRIKTAKTKMETTQ